MAGSVEDAYIAGYATAVLALEFQAPGETVRVQDGVITVNTASLGGASPEQVTAALSRIHGVTRVEIRQGATSADPRSTLTQATPSERRQAARKESTVSGPAFLPEGFLFDQLLADPRWPHFSIAYRYHMDDDELDHVGAANFGETFSLYRDRAPFGGQWEVGVQAGVFAIFDITADSKDLINADYFVALPLSYRYEDFSLLARVFHQSSHLGDEFVLRQDNNIKRLNFSYEGVDLKLSYLFFDALRLYGGPGMLFNEEPSDIDPWTTQYGAEFESPWTFASDIVRPVVAANFENNEENNWSTNISLRGGVQFESLRLSQRRLQLLIEYFKGFSPNGQFYTRKIETIGLGLHLRF